MVLLLIFFCHELNLAIEIDGGIHKKQIDYDKNRQQIIEENKIIFLRFKNEEVLNDLGAVLEKIKSLSLKIKLNLPLGK